MKYSTNSPIKEDYLSPYLEVLSAEMHSTILDLSGSVENPDQGDEWTW